MGPFIKKGTMLLRHCFWSLYATMRLGMSLVVEDVYILTEAPTLKMMMSLIERASVPHEIIICSNRIFTFDYDHLNYNR
jgi:hypothetical protein